MALLQIGAQHLAAGQAVSPQFVTVLLQRTAANPTGNPLTLPHLGLCLLFISRYNWV
jgi:hypothetical protein